MSPDGGKGERQEDEESVGTDFDDDDLSQKEIDEKKRRKKARQNKIRCRRYRDKKRKADAIVRSQMSKPLTIREQEEIIKRRREIDKQKSKRYRDKKRATNSIDSQTNRSSKTVAKHVSKCRNFHNSQIAGPSTRNVRYVSPTHHAGLWTRNEPYIPDSRSDYEESEDGNEEDAAQADGTKPKRIEQKQSEASHSFIPEESGTEDKYEGLGRYVALKVRQLDKGQRLFAERIINEALYEGQMGTLNMNSQLVVNTETFVCGQTSDGGTPGIEVLEIKVEKKDCARVKVEMDLENSEDVPSEYEDVMDDQSNSRDGAALHSFFNHCSGAERRRLEESDKTIESHLVHAPNIKAEVVTQEDNNLLENGETVTQLNPKRVFESNCSNNAKRKRLLETEGEKSFSEPHLGVVKVEVDIEENWNPLDSHSED